MKKKEKQQLECIQHRMDLATYKFILQLFCCLPANGVEIYYDAWFFIMFFVLFLFLLCCITFLVRCMQSKLSETEAWKISLILLQPGSMIITGHHHHNHVEFICLIFIRQVFLFLLRKIAALQIEHTVL